MRRQGRAEIRREWKKDAEIGGWLDRGSGLNARKKHEGGKIGPMQSERGAQADTKPPRG